MDNALRELLQKASARGSNYVKGDATLEELPGKMAELGVFLLQKTNSLLLLRDEKLKDELDDIQNKLDDMRKLIFVSKIQIK
ncbi:MAG: hypothetical protein OEW04_13815 [Nitrospirota bacterium]|nr:hypothetical protein [Nitrospirota bacterium]